MVYIDKELNLLEGILKNSVSDKKIDEYLNKLIEVNSMLWIIEDNIRECEKEKKFDEKFIQLARSVYQQNDKRASLKRQINLLYNSQLVEEKLYQ